MTTDRPALIRRLAALLAIVTLVAAVVVVATLALTNIVNIVIASVGVSIAIGGAWYSLSHRGSVRLIALATVLAGLAIVLAVLVVGDARLWPWVAVGAVAAVSVGAAGLALREPHDATPFADEPPAPRPRHPVLLMNPKSGGGKAVKSDLERECRDRGIEPIVLTPGDDLLQLAEDAVERGADVIGMAGGDGSQALVGTVASAHGIPHVVVPAGTRNHFALDLGLDRDDVVGALDAYSDGVDRTIDLAEVNGRVFVNNATLGLYARIVQSPEYRDAKVQTSLEMLPELIGPDARPLDLRFTGPDGEEVPTAAVILVSNGPYELQRAKGRGTRERLDDGVLGVATVTVSSASDMQKLVSLQAAGRLDRFEGWREWTSERFEVRSDGPVDVGVDGEALTLEPPIVFATRPGALTVRMPRHAPGRSPAAAAVRVTEASTIRALLRVAAGKPVAA
ncbi:MAG TPA: diacylglycerol kinase family protein [Actinomycetota bacterium]|jgi:diacylglycerol kinase family enzyme|nr:diacylglycerol kinase family protein [Actinomycetota bacterium]